MNYHTIYIEKESQFYLAEEGELERIHEIKIDDTIYLVRDSIDRTTKFINSETNNGQIGFGDLINNIKEEKVIGVKRENSNSFINVKTPKIIDLDNEKIIELVKEIESIKGKIKSTDKLGNRETFHFINFHHQVIFSCHEILKDLENNDLDKIRIRASNLIKEANEQ